MMNKTIVIIPVIVIVGIFLAFSFDGNKEDLPVFHVTLASPEQYEDGVYSDRFAVNKGNYTFRFVPNGDSPKNLEISLKGQNFEFSEMFVLNGTKHQTGISEYFTWDYTGEKFIRFETEQEVEIFINPNGNVRGPVSVSLIEN